MTKQNGLSTFGGAKVLINTMFGGGVIFLPEAFAHGGTIGSSLIFLFFAAVTYSSLFFLIQSANITGKSSYNELCELTGGNVLAVILDISIFISCYGVTFVYFSKIIRNIYKLIHADTPGSMNFKLIVIASVIGLMLFLTLCLKSLDKLSIVSNLTLFATIFVSVLFLYYSIACRDYATREPTVFFGSEMIKAIPTFAFAMGCQQNAVTIYKSLIDQTVSGGMSSMLVGVIIGFVIYTMIGLFGYITFGSSIKGEFLAILTGKASVQGSFMEYMKANKSHFFATACPIIVAVCFILILTAGFPCQSFAARASLKNLLRLNDTPGATLAINICHVIMVLLVAVMIKNEDILNCLVGFIGATVIPVISFAIPAFIFMRTTKLKNVSYYYAGSVVAASVASIFYMGGGAGMECYRVLTKK